MWYFMSFVCIVITGEPGCPALSSQLCPACGSEKLPEQEEPVQPGQNILHICVMCLSCLASTAYPPTPLLYQVGLAGLNIIGTAVSGGTGAGQQQFSLAEHSVLSEYDDLSFLMYTDTEVAQLVNKLERKKFEAVGTERFEYAKKIKAAIGE